MDWSVGVGYDLWFVVGNKYVESVGILNSFSWENLGEYWCFREEILYRNLYR